MEKSSDAAELRQASDAIVGKPERVPFDRIVTGVVPDHRRYEHDEAAIRTLAHSIETQGLLQPLVVAPHDDPGYYELIAGRRRHAAITLLREKEPSFMELVPVIVFDKSRPMSAMASLTENLERKDISPSEIAKGVKLLADMGYTQWQIATRLGRSTAWVKQYLQLANDADPVVLDALDKRIVTLREAKELAQLSPEEQRAALAPGEKVKQKQQKRTRPTPTQAREVAEALDSVAEDGDATPFARVAEAAAAGIRWAMGDISDEGFIAVLGFDPVGGEDEA